MRVIRGWKSSVAVATVAACTALALQATPAVAETPGMLIQVTPQADGWHGMADGSAISYWMTGSDGTPKQASGALFVPQGTPPAGGWPIVAFDHGTTGLGQGCGGESDPSTAPASHWHAEEDGIMQHLVAQGFAVVAPDYLGLGLFDTGPHPYLELRTEATATLDLLRAARSARPELSQTWSVLGLSQGGQAALGTGHLQSTYAPELDFRGTVAVDPESDVEKLLPIAGPDIPTLPGTGETLGFFASILAGLRAARPDVEVNQFLSPLGRTVIDEIGTMCKPEIEARVDGLGIGQLLSKRLSDSTLRAAYDSYLTVPTSGYDAPILLLVNITDTTVPSPLHGTLAAQLAANGADFRTVTGTGTHTQLNPQMWSALDTFLAHIKATPAQR
ncbi:alpha/beta fold hydrolase [Nocardia brasiliensis]|uniref:alpha/beta fold hydrolase n=1 Tax=Nocardia brasiliensis TaxID=37326 RepID=UPI002453DB41|nr:alpha/beta fold hydrolase [Nocardia brasiliensis]